MARYGLNLLEAKRLTLHDYHYHTLAYEFVQNDKHKDLALQAWFNQSVKATKGKGKNQRSAYRKFEDFYHHEKTHKQIVKGKDDKKVISLAEKNRQLRYLGKGGN